jgi:hypothetical protein
VKERAQARGSAVTQAASRLWTRLRCSRCRYASEHPGSVQPGNLDRCCALCGAPLGAVTTFRLSGAVPSSFALGDGDR